MCVENRNRTVDVGFQVDSSLSFLDAFVSEALAAGAAPYKPPHQRQEELAEGKGTSEEGMSVG